MKEEKAESTATEKAHGVVVSVLVVWAAMWAVGQTDVMSESMKRRWMIPCFHVRLSAARLLVN